MKEGKPDVLGLLVKHELAIKRLYEVFAARFTGHRDFWNKIVREEQKHADQLESLRSEPVLSKWLLIEKRLKAEVIQLSITYVDGRTAEAEAGQFVLVQALSIARDIESALLEKVFYRLGDSIPTEIEPILTEITADSERHRKSITALLAAEQRSR